MSLDIYKKRYIVKYEDINANARFKETTIGLIAQQVSAEHAQLLNQGYNELQQINKAWMMSRVVFEIYHSPKPNDEILIETWIEKTDRIHSYRNCHFYDKENKIFAAAQTAWMVVDTVKKDIDDVRNYVTNFPHIPNICMIKHSPDRIKPFTEKPQHVYTKHVDFSSLDLLGHVNNMKYVEWFIDGMPNNLQFEKQIEMLSINYIYEVFYNDVLKYEYICNQEQDSTIVSCNVSSEKSDRCVVAINSQLKAI
ncbi:MAG TPA: thioesterase [Salinivirgaceae bacterium]|nr:thioesterase [Salinivirgaceae bacterium]